MSWPYWVLAIYLIGVGLVAVTAVDRVREEDSKFKAKLNEQMDRAIEEDPELEVLDRNLAVGYLICLLSVGWPVVLVGKVFSRIKGLLTKSR